MSWLLSATAGARIGAEDIGDGAPVPPGQTRKVLHVIAVGEKGGIETVLLNLLGAAGPARWQGIVVALADGPFVAELRSRGVPTRVIHSGRLRNLFRGSAAVVRLRRFIASEGIDVVHSHGAKAHVFGGLAAALAGVPSVYHVHDLPIVRPNRNGVLNLLAATIRPSRTVACSAFVARNLSALHGEATVIHNGVPVTPPVPDRNRETPNGLGIDDASNVVLLPARLQRGKGIHIFLDAAAEVLKARQDVLFVIAGGTLFGLGAEYRRDLLRQAERLGISHYVRFVGHQTELGSLYRAAAFVVHASTDPEAFGMVLVEAMAYEKAVIASDAGGPREIVEDGVTGLLVPPGDSTGLARAILRLLSDPALATRMGQMGRRRVEAHFSSTTMARRVEALYDELAVERGRRA